MRARLFVHFVFVAALVTAFLAASMSASASAASGEHRCQVYFQHNSSSLSPEAILVANDVVLKIKGSHPREIVFVGHTDRTGRAAYNEILSKHRARSVADYVMKSLKPGHYRVRLKWNGEYNLPYPTRDGVSEPLNRCVEISMTPL